MGVNFKAPKVSLQLVVCGERKSRESSVMSDEGERVISRQ